MAEGAAGSRDTAIKPARPRLRPAAPTIKLENTCLKNYLVNHHVLRVLRSLSAYDLALRYLSGIEGFCNGLTKALKYGTLAARLYIIMYLYGGEWTCMELARRAGRCRQNVHKALTKLEKAGLAARSSAHRWRLKIQL